MALLKALCCMGIDLYHENTSCFYELMLSKQLQLPSYYNTVCPIKKATL